MAVISFENYVIDESYYKVNDNFDYSQDELNMPVTFSAEVGVDKNHEKAYVIILLVKFLLEEFMDMIQRIL